MLLLQVCLRYHNLCFISKKMYAKIQILVKYKNISDVNPEIKHFAISMHFYRRKIRKEEEQPQVEKKKLSEK